jgi:Autochaperone Domain Type 1
VSLTGVSVLTSGANSPGIQATGGDGVTGGGSSVTTAVLFGETPTPTTITTTGDNSVGAQADTGGQITLNGGSVTTSGTGSTGLYATGVDETTGAPSTITATGVAVTTGYNPPSNDPTLGTGSPGVLASAGGVASLSGGSVTTYSNSSPGLQASGLGSSITTTNGTTIATFGAAAYGVVADTSGVVTLNGGSVTTSGAGSVGLFATGDGSQIGATNVAVSGTTGTDAHALFVYQGGQITMTGGSATMTGHTAGGTDWVVGVVGGGRIDLNGTVISTTADGSGGIFINGAGGVINATGVTITTQGGVDSTSGTAAEGAYNGSDTGYPQGGTLVLTSTTITTAGLRAIGVHTNSAGSTTLTNSSVATSGQDAHALFVTGSGSQANLSGTNIFATQGAGAIGLYATLGGIVSATGLATVTTAGGVSPSTGLGAFGVNADGAGSRINLASATITTRGAGATGLFASDAASSGAAGSITVAGTLTLKTTNAAAAAIALQGDGASIFATGGGSINAAGDAIDFLGGNGQVATFDNFTIANTTGNLIFANPSVSTVNFNNTTANAGLNNLLDATNGSVITLNANKSALTGAIQTDSASTSVVNLINGSAWNMTGSSTVSNLAVSNSAIVFAPPNSGVGFKTLTVGNYAGAGANLTMNTALGGSSSPSDQLVIKGGSATGSTLLTIHNVGGAGAQTTGNGIPVVVAVSGGTTASNAFALANTPIVGGYRYSLQDDNNDWYLVSTPTSTQADIQNSVNNLARSQQQQIITNSGCWARSSSARPSRSIARTAVPVSARSAPMRWARTGATV